MLLFRTMMPTSLRLAAVVAALAATTAFAQSPRAAGPDAPAAPPVAPGPGLSTDLFYRILLGDVALQRGDAVLAARAYYEAAREAQDPRLARRAAEIALATRQRAIAEASARLWSELDPAAERPKQILAALASGAAGRDGAVAERDDEFKARLEKLLADAALSGEGVSEVFLQLNRAFAQQSDKLSVYRMLDDLARPYPASAEAQYAVALAAYNTGMPNAQLAKAAQEAVDRALKLNPGWDRAALLKADIIAKTSVPAAIDYLQGFLRQNPDARPAWGALAQLYIEERRYGDARTVFEKLWRDDPSAREFQFGTAALSFQMKDWDKAEQLFLDLKAAGYGDNGAVELYLAQIAEERKRYDEAIARYKAVPDGERGWQAKLRIAAILAKQGRMDEAKRYLAELPAVTTDQRVQVRQAEAQLLRDANDNVGAYAVLDRALVEFPDSTELLYDSAMVAEKLDRIQEAEAKLTRLVQLKPDDAHALNALGYTLVDRTPRIEEGYAFIQRAHKLAPEDPFILDSMGWALFRMGKLDEAADFLRRAMSERPDAEIAAHLGEVLWAKGERDRARDIWQTQLKLNPDNPVLLETVRRLSR
jgi:tetratricopeptide (TPR) repeat protein